MQGKCILEETTFENTVIMMLVKMCHMCSIGATFLSQKMHCGKFALSSFTKKTEIKSDQSNIKKCK